MAKKNLSLTPFARLFLVLLIAGPLCYIGASYYNGEDGVQNIKEMVGIGGEPEMKNSTTKNNETYSLEKENETLREKIKNLESENQALREQLNAK